MFTRLVPICSQTLLQRKAKLNHIRQDVDRTCSDFVPSLSNHGLCLTRNGASLDKIFTSNSHLSTFQNIFRPKQYHQEVENIKKDRSNHHFTFFMDGNSYKDLKRGMDWNSSSNTEFNIAIHSPNNIADIRGWYSKMITVPTGYTTKITIKLSQLKSDESTRGIDAKKRGCKFPDENIELSSVKWYSKVNCLLDCNMEFAENICGCRPWDYPTSDQLNKTSEEHQVRICDFYGSSCFNRALQENMAPHCDSQCIPDCDTIGYSMYIDKEPLDPKKRICNYLDEPFTILEFQIKKYIRSLFSENNWYGDVYDSPPERRMMNLMKDILLKNNESYHSNEKQAFERDCTEKLESDIAAVVVSIDSPTFSRMVKSVKATTFDKLATFGKFNRHFEGC